jgi:argininosuccinate synthase
MRAMQRARVNITSRQLSSDVSRGRVLLLYSGGLDTSVILRWLREEKYEVVCYMANLGQVEDFEKAKKKGMIVGAKSVHVSSGSFLRSIIDDHCHTL